MTPFQLFRETPARIRTRWPMIWKVLLCAALSMTLAVVLTAWQASRIYRDRHHHDDALAQRFARTVFPSPAETVRRMELGCEVFARSRGPR